MNQVNEDGTIIRRENKNKGGFVKRVVDKAA